MVRYRQWSVLDLYYGISYTTTLGFVDDEAVVGQACELQDVQISTIRRSCLSISSGQLTVSMEAAFVIEGMMPTGIKEFSHIYNF